MNHQFNGKNQRWQNREFYWVEDAAIQINASMRSCCIWRLATLNSCLCFATILSRSVTTTSCHFLFILQCLPCTQKTKIYLVFYLNRQSMRRNGTVEKDGGLRSGPAREVKEFVIEQCSLWQEWFEVAKHVKMALIIIILPVLNKIEKCLVGEHCSFSTWRRMAGYLSCERWECALGARSCLVRTCSASLTFRLINIRSEVVVMYMSHGLVKPCLLLASDPLSFANPAAPLYGHLSSLTSSATSVLPSQAPPSHSLY